LNLPLFTTYNSTFKDLWLFLAGKGWILTGFGWILPEKVGVKMKNPAKN
jgi:hypothetical protein